MKILKISFIKKKSNDIEKDFLRMKLINKIKATSNFAKDIK